MAKNNKLKYSVPLVAIDMGSDAFRAMAAELCDDQRLRVLGVETSNRFPCVKRGVIDNTSNAGFMISEMLKLLANRIQVKELPSAFVCVGGRTLQIVQVFSKRDQVREREVSQYLLDEMEVECKQKIEARNPNAAVLDLVPYYYKLDGIEQDYAPTKEQRATLVEAHFIAFVGLKELEQKVLHSFDRSGKLLEHMYVRPDALMNVLATDDDLRQGCAVIDFGAQTTTLTIFKGTQYLHNKVVAMGGYDITRDIELLGIPFARAERVKCEYGWASPNLVPVGEGDDPDSKVLRTKREVAKIIESRLNTTLEPLFEILEKEAERLKVVYLTGAGSMLQGLEQYVQAHTSVPVMYGSHAEWLTSDTPDEMCMPSYSSLIGTLLLGASYRKTHPEKKPTRSSKIFEFLTVETLDLFSGHTHDDYKKDETQLKK